MRVNKGVGQGARGQVDGLGGSGWGVKEEAILTPVEGSLLPSGLGRMGREL